MKRRMITLILAALLLSGCGRQAAPTGGEEQIQYAYKMPDMEKELQYIDDERADAQWLENG